MFSPGILLETDSKGYESLIVALGLSIIAPT